MYIQAIIFFFQFVCSLGIEPTTFYTANAMLYHWATGTSGIIFKSLNEIDAHTLCKTTLCKHFCCFEKVTFFGFIGKVNSCV